jgi:uncharacterized ion transporter superfamily protein YfcC
MWFSAIKLAVSAGSHIYKNKQQTKMLMSDAAMKHAQKMSTGELEYSGKLLEARQSDWKDEFILILLSIPIVMLGWSVILYIWKKSDILCTLCTFGPKFLLGSWRWTS